MMTKDAGFSSVGGSLEDFLEEEGLREEVYGEAIKAVLSWQLEIARKEQALTKTAMASKMGTSRTQLDRVLDPHNVAVTVDTLDKAARSLGKKLVITLVDA
jgi:hypothetical protein